jgi:hypothetical protein
MHRESAAERLRAFVDALRDRRLAISFEMVTGGCGPPGPPPARAAPPPPPPPPPPPHTHTHNTPPAASALPLTGAKPPATVRCRAPFVRSGAAGKVHAP